jgi:argininosuccinate synthase
MKRAVLAYCGGLDTSVTIRWLVEQGYDVFAVAVDVGQQEDLDAIRERGGLAGAAEVRVIPAVDRFAGEFVTRAVKANALYEGKYPLVSSLARPLIADEVVRVAREVGAGAVAHGCTGKGNDQVRFEVSFGVLAPDLLVLAPIRDAAIPREKALGLAGEWGIPITQVAMAYSIDENLWGRTAECGPLEDPWVAPPEDAFTRTAATAERPTEPTEIAVGFERGVPVMLDGDLTALPDLVRTVDALGGRYGFGRVDMIENRQGRDQVARALRGARGARAHRGPPGPGGSDPRTRGSPREAPGRTAVGRARLRRAVVLAASGCARCVRGLDPRPRERRGPTALLAG